MKRTLLEILAVLAVLGLMVSLHHQVARVKAQNAALADIKTLVNDTLATRPNQEIAEVRAELMRAIDAKVESLQVQVAEASQRHENTAALRAELARERELRQAIVRDVDQTKTLMGNYVDEMRASRRTTRTTLAATRDELEKVRGKVLPDHRSLTESMLQPTVQLNGDDTVGSGTMVFSGVGPVTNEVESYVLTSYHVVRNILADTPSAKTEGVLVTVYLEPPRRRDVRADMILHDVRIDAALLKVRGNDRFPSLADVLPVADAERVEVWADVIAVGCPLGNDPIPTHGAISSLRNELNGANYWMINAPTYFGNSGGGIYLTDSRQLVGVFSKIYTHGKGNPVVIPHMGLCTPITAVRSWLGRHDLDWVLNKDALTEPGVDPSNLAAPPK